MPGLLFNGEVLVNNSETTLLGKSDGHSRLGNGIHCCTEYRNAKYYIPAQSSMQTDLSRMKRRPAG